VFVYQHVAPHHLNWGGGNLSVVRGHAPVFLTCKLRQHTPCDDFLRVLSQSLPGPSALYILTYGIQPRGLNPSLHITREGYIGSYQRSTR
jgi:hypothetical protein